MDSPDNFTYHELAGGDIRLLTYSQSTGSGKTLSFRLTHHQFNGTELHYNAVSYAWGNSKAEYRVVINGKEFYVRKNAHDFLQHQDQNGDREVPFWMDSICMNQNDLDEKSWQVGMMAQIFARADNVMIWLGQYSESGALVGPYQRYLKAQYEFQAPVSLHKVYNRAKTAWKTKALRLSSDIEYEELLTVMRVVKPLINDLLLADYWERLWIVQEFMLAKSGFIVAGTEKIEFKYINNLVGFEFVDTPAARLVTEMCSNRRTHTFSGNGVVGPQETIARVIKMCQKQKCSDRHDRVYGLLGLSHDLDGLQVNYRESPEVLFARLIRQLLDNGLGRSSDVIGQIPTFMSALEIDMQRMDQALEDGSESEVGILTKRNIPMELTCEYLLQPLPYCTRSLSSDCPNDLSRLLEPGNQHITLQSWTDNKACCFEKSLARPNAMSRYFSSLQPATSAVLCRISRVPGWFVLVAVGPNKSCIQQSFSQDWTTNPLLQKYTATFEVEPRSASVFSIQLSPADLVVLHQSFDSSTKSDFEARDKIVEKMLLR